MIFTAPALLLGLAALPVLWWLLRVTPPAPKVQSFPAIGLLLGLCADQPTAARTPWWLLLLRTIVAALVTVGLSGPVLVALAGNQRPGHDSGKESHSRRTTRPESADHTLSRSRNTGNREGRAF